jgi:hypothetical protein
MLHVLVLVLVLVSVQTSTVDYASKCRICRIVDGKAIVVIEARYSNLKTVSVPLSF